MMQESCQWNIMPYLTKMLGVSDRHIFCETATKRTKKLPSDQMTTLPWNYKLVRFIINNGKVYSAERLESRI